MVRGLLVETQGMTVLHPVIEPGLEAPRTQLPDPHPGTIRTVRIDLMTPGRIIIQQNLKQQAVMDIGRGNIPAGDQLRLPVNRNMVLEAKMIDSVLPEPTGINILLTYLVDIALPGGRNGTTPDRCILLAGVALTGNMDKR